MPALDGPGGAVIVAGFMDSTPQSSRVFHGILLMLAAGFGFTLMDAAAKYMTQRYPIVEVAWGRYLFHALSLPLIVGRFGGLSTVRSRNLWVQLLRSLLLLASTVFFWLALRFIPLADATAVGFVGPLILTALSVPFLGEKVGTRRWAAVCVGFLGALVIIRPGPNMAQPAALLPLLSASSFAGYAICTRILSRSDSWATTIIWSSVVGLVVLSVLVPLDWHTPDATGWLGMAILGALGSGAHLLMILAYARAPASTLAPLSYIQLITSTALGYFLFGSFPDRWTLIGGCIVAASGLYVIHRERLRRAQRDA